MKDNENNDNENKNRIPPVVILVQKMKTTTSTDHISITKHLVHEAFFSLVLRVVSDHVPSINDAAKETTAKKALMAPNAVILRPYFKFTVWFLLNLFHRVSFSEASGFSLSVFAL